MCRLFPSGTHIALEPTWSFGLVVLLAACLAPWSEVVISPEIRGRVETASSAGAPRYVRLVLRHRENPSLHRVEDMALGPAGEFSFAPVVLPVAGREYSKFYRAFLHLYQGEPQGPAAEPPKNEIEAQRVVWRAEFSRGRLSGPVELRCVLDRPVALGQP